MISNAVQLVIKDVAEALGEDERENVVFAISVQYFVFMLIQSLKTFYLRHQLDTQFLTGIAEL